jgi:hypothetical protein
MLGQPCPSSVIMVPVSHQRLDSAQQGAMRSNSYARPQMCAQNHDFALEGEILTEQLRLADHHGG